MFVDYHVEKRLEINLLLDQKYNILILLAFMDN